MFERYETGENAVLVHVDFTDELNKEDIQELQMLVSSAGVNQLTVITAKRTSPHAKFFVGTGKVEEIASVVQALNADVVIFNHALSPSQERNIEAVIKCRVLDRTSLILDIFAQRARTHEGKLQVELAQLKHISTRLVRGWTHLERQKGGIGLRGPGETQLESDRRLIRGRIKSILRRLERVQKQREQGRRARKRAEIPSVSLVGYTNAGKSTLFNTVTKADVYAADQLFATLDPTLRKIELDEIGPVILADTVGFIRHLPHDLVAAFKATLLETKEADLLLHVVDFSDQQYAHNIDQVNAVLEEIDASDVAQLIVCNKIDRLAEVEPHIDYDQDNKPERVWISAQQEQGIELLKKALTERLRQSMVHYDLCVPAGDGKVRGLLFEQNCIKQQKYSEKGEWLVSVTLPTTDWHRLDKKVENRLSQYVIN
ncbi:MAG: ribosome rescue GTPase HflX [Pseudomonadota bacterium]